MNEVDRAGMWSYCRILIDGLRAVSKLPAVNESPLTQASSAANHCKPANLVAAMNAFSLQLFPFLQLFVLSCRKIEYPSITFSVLSLITLSDPYGRAISYIE